MQLLQWYLFSVRSYLVRVEMEVKVLWDELTLYLNISWWNIKSKWQLIVRNGIYLKYHYCIWTYLKCCLTSGTSEYEATCSRLFYRCRPYWRFVGMWADLVSKNWLMLREVMKAELVWKVSVGIRLWVEICAIQVGGLFLSSDVW